MKEKIKTIFIGTPDFAVPSLKSLIKDERFEIISVITQPDKKIGRKQLVTPSPVKIEAKKHNIPILQPDKIIDLKSKILNLKPDIIIVIAYAQIIPEEILTLPKYGVINIHGSLLPKYRGASCIQAAILNGDNESGITIMKMDNGLDTGPILKSISMKILPSDTADSLYDKLSKLGAETLIPIILKYISGEIKLEPQNDKKASYVGMLNKRDGEINWSKPADEIERFIKAMYAWPGAWTKIENKKIKILEVNNKILTINNYKNGELFLYNNVLAIQCGKNALVIKKIQIEGKKEMSSEEFLRGHKNYIGKIFT